jgi:hypothetical protein
VLSSHWPTFTFEGSLARKPRFRIFTFHFLREVSHESFVFTSFILTFGGKSRKKALSSHLPFSLFKGSLARNGFLNVSRCTKFCVLIAGQKKCPGRWMGKLVRRAVGEHVRLGSFSDRPRNVTGSSGRVFADVLAILLCFATRSLQIGL